MDKLANDTFSYSQEESTQLFQENFKVFRSLVAQARDFADRSEM
jgi:hypothetical protein